MSDLSQLKLKGDYIVRLSHNDIKSPLKRNSQSLWQSLFKVKVVLGLVVSLTVLVGGIYIVTGPQDVMTTGDLDTRSN